MTTILVTGATGTIGSQVVKALRGHAGVTVHAAVRSADKAKGLTGDNVSPVDFDYENEATIAKAVEGVDKVFFATPYVPNQIELATRLVDAAKKAGVKQVVKLSAIGCEVEPGIQLGRWHRGVEKLIEASGIPYTFLRPNNFFENFIGYYPPGKDGNIYLPWGTAGASFIAGSDIAAVAKVSLTESGHENKAYALTGPESITIAQVAKAIAEVAGRPVQYVDVPEEGARQGMLGAGMPSWMVEPLLELHAIDKAGYAAEVSGEVERLTGKKPQSFLEFARQNAAKWRI